MKAQVIHEFGDADVFKAEELPDPVAGPGQVLVKVHAASVNPVDYKLRSAGPDFAPDLPAVLGCDIAGEVLSVGAAVTDFSAGDAVYGCAGGVKGVPGAYAELFAADARLLAPKPANLDMRQAAALPLVTITAWEGLERAGLSKGQTCLIHGGTGGVGHIAVQLAKARGARVFATVSSDKKAALARELGADETINYRNESVEDYVAKHTDGAGFDVVVDTTGGSELVTSFEAAKLNAQVVTIVSIFEADLTLMHIKGLSLHVVFMLIPMLHDINRASHGKLLREAAKLVEGGKLRPVLDEKQFSLDAVADAHRHLEGGKAVGKVVIDVS